MQLAMHQLTARLSTPPSLVVSWHSREDVFHTAFPLTRLSPSLLTSITVYRHGGGRRGSG